MGIGSWTIHIWLLVGISSWSISANQDLASNSTPWWWNVQRRVLILGHTLVILLTDLYLNENKDSTTCVCK